MVLPLGGRKLVGGLGFGAVREVASGVRLHAGAAEVEVVPAWHPTRRWPRSPQLDALGFLVDGIWFAGDTDLNERMAELRGRVEVALVPIWGWGPSLGPGHLDPSARRARSRSYGRGSRSRSTGAPISPTASPAVTATC